MMGEVGEPGQTGVEGAEGMAGEVGTEGDPGNLIHRKMLDFVGLDAEYCPCPKRYRANSKFYRYEMS